MSKIKGWFSTSLVFALLALTSAHAAELAARDLEYANAAFRDGDCRKAKELFGVITMQDPGNADYWTKLGDSRRQLNDMEGALEAYAKALAVDNGFFGAQFGSIPALAEMDRLDEAFALAEKTVAQGLSLNVLEIHPAFELLRGDDRMKPLAEAAERKARPCKYQPVYQEFDFWVGDWDVWVGGKKRARNQITEIQDGCIIREYYTNDFGYSGESYNYYDPQTKTWRQNWVDSGGGIVRYEGGFSDGAMRMEGVNISTDGSSAPAKVSWTPNPDGTVHHEILQSRDGGKTWFTYFDAIYRKRDLSGNRDD